MAVTGRASDLNSLPSSNKVSLLTRKQTPQPRTGSYNVEYKCKQQNDCIVIKIEKSLKRDTTADV